MIKFTALLLFSFILLYSQENEFTIHGYIEDAASGEKLIGANIYQPVLNLGSSTNRYGYFSFTLPAGNHQIIINYIGYKTDVQELQLDQDIELNIKLEQSLLSTDSIVVIAEAFKKIEEETQMSVIEIPIEQIKMIPAIAGEVDLLKAIQLLPGVQSGSEGTSGIYVRGGGPDQNLIIIDDAPVYNAMHLFGFLSVFNADAIKNVSLTKGGFPARYGGRLSSVLDIRMKDGNMKEFKGKANIGVIATKATWEGPLIKDKTSFIVTGRRTYIDILTRPFIEADSDGSGGYYFYDFNAKLNHIFSNSDRIYFSLYTGDDRFYSDFDNDEFDLGWGNFITTLRWNHIYNSKLFGNSTLIYSKYIFDINGSTSSGGDRFTTRYFSGVEDIGLKLDFDYVPTPRQYIRFGANLIHHKFSPGAFTFKEKIDGETNTQVIAPSKDKFANEAVLYFEDDIKINNAISFNAGLHTSLFNVENKNYYSLQPRLSGRYQVVPGWAIKSSYVMMNQYIHLLSNSGIGMPTDLWVPATKKVPQQKSWQAAFGVAHTLEKEGLELSLEGYYKKMDDLIAYKEGSSFFGFDNSWEDKVAKGSGESYGVELFVQKKTGNTSGWLGYTLSWSKRTFTELNNGETFPYKYDRRHDISLTVTHTFNQKWDMGMVWVFGTGNSVTLPIGQFYQPGFDNRFPNSFYNEAKEYTSRNGYRMAAYHRLDLSFNYHTESNSTWTFSIYNAYNQKNPYYLYFDEKYDKEGQLIKKQAKQVSLFPIIPSINYGFTF